MKSTFRHYPRLITLLLLACVTALVAIIPGGQSIYAQQGKSRQPDAPVGSGFTYQGQLKDGVNPANGPYDLQFKLYDAASSGTQVGSTVTIANQTVTGGLFTVVLDFGTSAFSGQARWLEIAVRPAGGGTYTTLAPRQPLTAVPYAQSLATGSSGAVITGTLPGPALIVTNTNGTAVQGNGANGGAGVWGSSTNIGVYGDSTSGTGVYGGSDSGTGVYGASYNDGSGVEALGLGNSYALVASSDTNTAVRANSNTGIGVHGSGSNKHGGLFTNNSTIGFAALQGIASGTPGYGIYGEGNSIGVWGSTTNGTGVRGVTTGGYGVHGYSVSNGTGVRGESPSGNGVYGLSTSDIGRGVFGENTSNSGYGVYGVNNANNTLARGVVGVSNSGYGVTGLTDTGNGVRGQANSGIAVYGSAPTNGTGLFGDGYTAGVVARGTLWAGIFQGDIRVDGNCQGCLGPDKIDHPGDPENKFLQHFVVESSEMLDIYSGNITTDAKGHATVVLPDWFQLLNVDFRYQLTVVGQFAQAIISSEIKNNHFVIATDKPNVKVSWQVTGTRNDPYSKAHPPTIEVEKTQQERGKYLHPTEWGQPESAGIKYEGHQQGISKP